MEGIIKFLITTGTTLAENCFSAIIVLAVGLYLSKYVTKFCVRAMQKAKVETTVITFMKSVISTSLKVIVIISALGVLGFPTTSLVAIFGTAGAALALGFKDNLGNFVSGIIILFTKPFKVDDFVEIDAYAGTVKEIQIMFTVLNTIDNKRIIVPNSEMTTNIIINGTQETERRLEITFDVAYNQDIDEAKNIINRVIQNHPKAYSEPAPLVRVSGYMASSVQILVRVWCYTDDYMDLKFDLLEQIKKEFDDHHIRRPEQALDINVKNN